MWQRARQFFEAGRRPAPADHEFARQWLAPELAALFAAQHPRDIVHSAGTARWLLARGHTDPDLITAAFLHDIGKGEQRRLDRVAYVVAGWARAGAAVGDAGSRHALRRAVARSAAHARAGAAAMRQAGASERAAALTAAHHEPAAGDPLLDLLQQADAAN